MPRIRMSSNFELQKSHFRFDVREPKSCSGAQEKIDNLRRQLGAIRTQKEEALALQDRLEFYNRAILVSGLIKETCYSFLDLAVSLGSAVLPPPMGKKVELVGNAGMGAMEMTETGTEYVLGQANGRDVIRTGVGALNKNLPATDNIQKTLQYGTSQNLEMADLMGVAKKGDKEKTRTQVLRTGTNMSLDAVIFQLDTMPDNTPGAKYMKSGVSTVKAAKRYSDALDDALDGYLDEKMGIAETRFAIKQQMRFMVEAAEEKLDKALKDFSHCAIQ